MGDDMGGFKHGGPLVGYQHGRRPPLSPWPSKGPMSWKLHEPLIPRLPSHLRPTPAQLGKVGRGLVAGLPGLIAMALMQATTGSDPISEVFWPEKLGDPNEAKYFEELDERAFRDKMDEKHGIGWSTTIGKSPRINPGRRIDLSRVMRYRR